MKKNIKVIAFALFWYAFFIAILFLLPSCENEQNVRSDINRLRATRKELQFEVFNLEQERNTLRSIVDEFGVFHGNVGIFVLEIKQSTFTINIGEHIKNKMNAIEISIPVDYDFYTQYNEGDIITSEGKMGSFLIDGDFSNLNIKVKKKYSILRGID
jgi:hypothetical protein